jgi:cell wall-associated NlpC family hydrolase
MVKRLLVVFSLPCLALTAQADFDPTPQQLQAIVAEANTWKGTPYRLGGRDKKGIDCSWFVHAAYPKVLKYYKYYSASDYLRDPIFRDPKVARVGNLIVFPATAKESAHVGIITDPNGMKFIGSQTSTGVAEASYAPNSYWGKRPWRVKELR